MKITKIVLLALMSTLALSTTTNAGPSEVETSKAVQNYNTIWDYEPGYVNGSYYNLRIIVEFPGALNYVTYYNNGVWVFTEWA